MAYSNVWYALGCGCHCIFCYWANFFIQILWMSLHNKRCWFYIPINITRLKMRSEFWQFHRMTSSNARILCINWIMHSDCGGIWRRLASRDIDQWNLLELWMLPYPSKVYSNQVDEQYQSIWNLTLQIQNFTGFPQVDHHHDRIRMPSTKDNHKP